MNELQQCSEGHRRSLPGGCRPASPGRGLRRPDDGTTRPFAGGEAVLRPVCAAPQKQSRAATGQQHTSTQPPAGLRHLHAPARANGHQRAPTHPDPPKQKRRPRQYGGALKRFGGPGQNRTGVDGFADRSLTTRARDPEAQRCLARRFRCRKHEGARRAEEGRKHRRVGADPHPTCGCVGELR